MSEFEHEYDFRTLRVIRPQKRDFQMLVTPRFVHHFVENTYEDFTSDLLLNFLRDDTLFIDIGAHYGYYTLLVGTKYPKAKIIAIEPVAENYEILKQNVALNKLENVETHDLALSDRNETREFNIAEASDSCGFYEHPLTRSRKVIEMETVSLDNLMEEVPKVPLIIKIDTEGHEVPVLDGMEKVISNAVDIKLIVEFNPKCLRSAGYDPTDLLKKILQFGFDIYFIDDDKRMTYKLADNTVEKWNDYVDEKSSTPRIRTYINLLCIKKDKSLSVCFFSHSALLYGAERSLLELVTELVRDHGVLCSVVLPGDGPLKSKLEQVGASTLIIDYSWWSDSSVTSGEDRDSRLTNSFKKVLAHMRQKLGKLNPDIIFTNTMVIPWGAIAASFLGKPHVWFIHEFGTLDHCLKFFQPFDFTLDFIKTSSNIVLTNSDAVRKALFGNGSKRNIVTIYSHISIPSDALSRDKNNYFTRTSASKLVVSGTVREGKGQKDAILAVKELVRRRKDIELVIMGDRSTEYGKHLETIVKDENLEAYIKFIGFKEDPYPVMNQADIVLVCSRSEAFGRVTLEAMLLKKPVIGTSTGGTRELITEGFNGLLYTPGDYVQLADKIEYFLKHREKIKEFGGNGYKFAKKKFSRKAYGGRVYKLLKGLRNKANLLSSPYSNLVSGLVSNALSELDEKNAEIAEISGTLQAKDSQISNLEASLQEKVSQIAELSSLVQAKDSQISNLEAQIQQIQRGIVMQLVNRYQRIIERLLRPGTRRRYYYELALAGIRVILNEGWKSFWYKFRRWFKQQASLRTGIGRESDRYQQWIAQNEPKPEDLERQRQESLSFQYRPKISIITPVWNPEARWLQSAIESVLNQTYDNWEFCLAEGGSTNKRVSKILQEYAVADARIKVINLRHNRGIAGNSNEALRLATGEFVGFLDHDDKLAPNALFEVVKLLNEQPDADFIYSDEVLIDEEGRPFYVYYRPDFSLDYMLSHCYIVHFVVIRKRVIDKIGGFREEFVVSQDYDLFLRAISETRAVLHIAKALYWMRVHPKSADHKYKEQVTHFSTRALTDFLAREGIEGEVLSTGYFNFFRVKRQIQGRPLISIIIPTRDGLEFLKNCVESIEGKTTYRNYEVIIVDHLSKSPATLDYFHYMQTHYPNYRVVKFEEQFNFSRLNNYAARHSNGEHLVFLNNDTEVITGEWLEAMLEHSQRNEIACVGAKLLYPDSRIQHVGVVIGLCGPAEHIYKFSKARGDIGYMGHFVSIRNWSALTAACMMIKKSVFDQLGGYDEAFAVGFGDTDLCVRAQQKGYLNVFTPYAQLYHHESATRGGPFFSDPHPQDSALFKSRWQEIIDDGDPYYNPNLPTESLNLVPWVELP